MMPNKYLSYDANNEDFQKVAIRNQMEIRLIK